MPKIIRITKGYEALVEDEDFERINNFRWFANVNGYQVRAARHSMRKMIYMHHQVLEIMPWNLGDKEVDHIDRNPLNNCRSNLRLVSHAENMRNSRIHIERVGYCFNYRANLWTVYLDRPGKRRKYLGYTRTKEEAILRITEARLENT